MNHNKADKTNKNSALGFISSVKLAIFLLIVLACASIIGTLIFQAPQTANFTAVVARYAEIHPVKYKIFNALGFFNLYYSWWYKTLLALLALNLIACSIKSISRLAKVLQNPKIKMSNEHWNSLKNKEKFTIKSSLENSFSSIKNYLKHKGFSLQEEKEDQTAYVFAQKGSFSHIGIHIAHFSILIIFIGAVISLYWGFNGTMEIVEGTTKGNFYMSGTNELTPLDFEVRCDNFEKQFHEDQKFKGMIKEYLSTLTIVDNGQDVFTKTIQVNDPLSYKGIRLFQSHYKEIIQGGKAILNLRNKEAADIPPLNFGLALGEEKSFFDGSLTVKLIKFIPDFIMQGPNRIMSRSENLNNPAAQLSIRIKDSEPHNLWIFQKFPDMQMSKVNSSYQFNLTGFKGRECTGLQVAKDPGANVVWVGCLLLIISLFIAFFTSHKRIWCRLEKQGNDTLVKMGGNASKNRFAFERYFYELSKKIKEQISI